MKQKYGLSQLETMILFWRYTGNEGKLFPGGRHGAQSVLSAMDNMSREGSRGLITDATSNYQLTARGRAFVEKVQDMDEDWPATVAEKTYMSSVPCKRHPNSPRYVASSPSALGRCVECNRLAARQRYARLAAAARDRKLRADLGDLY